MLATPALASPKSASSLTLDQQFEEWLDWFPGRYDSARQRAIYAYDGTPASDQNYRRHSVFRRVDLPAIGDTVMLAHQYRDGDPTKVYRQRLYTLTLALERQAIRLRVHVPEDKKVLRGAYQNPSRLKDLTLDDFTIWDGCDLFWQKEGETYVGRLDPGTCQFDSEAFGQTIVLEETLTLTQGAMTFADRGLSLSGDYLFGMRGTEPNQLLRARPFLCATPFGPRWMHDQGGIAKFGDQQLILKRWIETENGIDEGLSLSLLNDGQLQTRSLGKQDAEQISIVDGGRNTICRLAPETLYSEG